MKKVLVRYKVKTGKVAENEQLIKEVYKQLHNENIDGFRYITLKLDDGVTFVHIAFADTEQASIAFSNLSAFKDFQANIKERCDEYPVVGQVTVVGAYNFQTDAI
jgi:hypothetical protein